MPLLEMAKDGSVRLDDICNALQAEVDMLDVDIAKAKQTIKTSKKRLTRAMKALSLIKKVYAGSDPEEPELQRCDICGARSEDLEAHKRTHFKNGQLQTKNTPAFTCICGFVAATKAGIYSRIRFITDGRRHELAKPAGA